MENKGLKVAQVYKIHSDFYYLKDKNGGTFTCKLRDILKKQQVEIYVGDKVELSEDLNFISKLIIREHTHICEWCMYVVI